MQTKLAFDIVLLPPPDATRRIIALTAHLPVDDTRLNSTTCLPHLSLLQGVLASDSLSQAERLLKVIAARHTAFGITMSSTRAYTNPDQRVFSQLVADPTTELIRLHRDSMDSFRNLLESDEVTTDMFVSPPEVNKLSMYWVRTWYEQRDKEGFDPHITLGAGRIDKLDAPIEFRAERLALCQLGTYCTCRKILAETTLTS